MHASLRGYTTAVIGDTARDRVGGEVADELNAVAHLVSRTNALAVTLSDFGVPIAARRAVLEDLLTPRVHPASLRIVLKAVELERADEFPTILHELYELVRHMHELGLDEYRAEEPIVGRRAWREFAAGYADAVFENVAETSELELIEDDLFRFARVVESNHALSKALSDATTPVENREHLLNDLLEDRARPATVRLARITLQGRVRDIATALDWLVERAALARGWRVARVVTALPIEVDERRGMEEALQKLTHQPVELQILEDADLLGGAVVQIGDLLVDASTRHRLDQLEEHLLRPETTIGGARRSWQS